MNTKVGAPVGAARIEIDAVARAVAVAQIAPRVHALGERRGARRPVREIAVAALDPDHRRIVVGGVERRLVHAAICHCPAPDAVSRREIASLRSQ